MLNTPTIRPYPTASEATGAFNAELADGFQCLSTMYQIIVRSQREASYHDGVEKLLQAASRRFASNVALVVAPISDSVCEIIACSGDTPNHYVGQHIQVPDALSRKLRTTNGYLALTDLNSSTLELPFAQKIGCASGALLASHLQSAGGNARILLFLSREPRTIDSEDIELLRLSAEGVAFLLDLQHSQPKQEDMAVVAHGPVKSLEEYIERARLPTQFGISARVQDTLIERISNESLALGHIAVALGVSKRTLQRRLQEQNVNFADLRDQVRFHFAIQFLIYEKRSIDKVSEALDFSDRMSFTNAFKRWTGLSPSVFRRLFIDYA